MPYHHHQRSTWIGRLPLSTNRVLPQWYVVVMNCALQSYFVLCCVVLCCVVLCCVVLRRSISFCAFSLRSVVVLVVAFRCCFGAACQFGALFLDC